MQSSVEDLGYHTVLYAQYVELRNKLETSDHFARWRKGNKIAATNSAPIQTNELGPTLIITTTTATTTTKTMTMTMTMNNDDEKNY